MGLLKRLKKTPDENLDEDQDEFNAEENGLLMVPSLPSDAQKSRSEGDPASPPARGETEANPDEAAQPSPVEGEPSDAAAASPPAQAEAEQTAPEEASPGQGSEDDAMALFKASAAEQTSLLPVLKEALETISAADLLAEARSVRDQLLHGQARDGGE